MRLFNWATKPKSVGAVFLMTCGLLTSSAIAGDAVDQGPPAFDKYRPGEASSADHADQATRANRAQRSAYSDRSGYADNAGGIDTGSVRCNNPEGYLGMSFTRETWGGWRYETSTYYCNGDRWVLIHTGYRGTGN